MWTTPLVRIPQIPFYLVGMRGMQRERQHPMGHFLEIKHRIPVESSQLKLFEEDSLVARLVPRPFC
jgi:hypothetical protein